MTSLSKQVYMLLLLAGRAGMTLDDVARELDLEPWRVRSVLRGLMRSRKVVKMKGKYFASSSVRSRFAGGELCRIEVERVYKGFAVVKVNDRFRARLSSTDYNGPSGLIKRGSVFMARATVTRIDGRTGIVVHDVVQTLE
ncbi:MAG: hypothetical protein ABDH63_03630 [Candidatus Caldarchaeales archaeon]